MSAPQRRHTTGLIDQLLTEPHRFEFFQAVRLLDLWLRDPDRPVNEVVPSTLRFRNSVSLSFPPSEIESLRVLAHEAADSPNGSGAGPAAAHHPRDRIEITPAFMGLLGANGTLPLAYTEQILQRDTQQKDSAARGFLDVFSHRAVSLFYAAWKKHRLHLQYETERRQRYLPLLLSLVGVGTTTLQGRLKPDLGGVADESLAFFSGTLQQRQRSATQVQQLLRRYLGVPTHVEQFQGSWYLLPKEACTSLGQANGVLGRNALAGERVWQRDLRVKLTLGPLDHAAFRRFLPGAPGTTALTEVLTLLNGVSLEYEVNLSLKAEAVQGSALQSGRSPLAGRLGWDTYLQTRPEQADRCDVRYDIHGAIPA